MSKLKDERINELENTIVEAFAELDKADGSRIGLQESIDACQAIMREGYGDLLDADVESYVNGDDDDDTEEDDDDEDEDELPVKLNGVTKRTARKNLSKALASLEVAQQEVQRCRAFV
jgi:DNA-directed RNA polymerase specialized sigma subunit